MTLKPARLLTGMTALVTGAGRGIGRAMAVAFAAEGARVGLLARSADELHETRRTIEEAGGVAVAVPADVTDEGAVREACAAVQGALGPVDVLVNNAGLLGPIGPVWESDPAGWWRAVEVNVRGPFLCAHALLPGMIERRRGRIINVATAMTPMTYLSSYLAGKTALVRLTEVLALETKPFGIACFSISPGTVRTAMAEMSLESEAGKKWIPWFRRVFDEGINVPPERPARLAVTIASGRVDALSGRYLTPFDDLEFLLAHAHEIEQEQLYSLRLRPHPQAAPHPSTKIREAATQPRLDK